ncbi:hypothetical protein PF004_g25827, partial [Phytophthora fragariae]
KQRKLYHDEKQRGKQQKSERRGPPTGPAFRLTVNGRCNTPPHAATQIFSWSTVSSVSYHVLETSQDVDDIQEGPRCHPWPGL